jgi:hypothetical protein
VSSIGADLDAALAQHVPVELGVLGDLQHAARSSSSGFSRASASSSAICPGTQFVAAEQIAAAGAAMAERDM